MNDTDGLYPNLESHPAASPVNPATGAPYFTIPETGWGTGWNSSETGIPVSSHKLNADHTVAVATDVFWNEDMEQAPRGVKLQLLGAGGVAVYGPYHGDAFWQAWAPLPKRRKP